MPDKRPSRLRRPWKLPSVEHKYQTIQSVRPEEVKEFFSQHFLEADGTPKTSLPEDGVRRFSLVQRTFKTRKALRNSKDAALFKEEMQSLEGKKILEEMRTSNESQSGSETGSTASSATRDAIEAISLRDEVTRLNTQLKQEREAHTKELARLRAQVRAFELKLNNTHKQMETLVITMEAREKAVQELLAKTRVVEEEGLHENGEGQEETNKTSSSPTSSSTPSSAEDTPLSPPISMPAFPSQANIATSSSIPQLETPLKSSS